MKYIPSLVFGLILTLLLLCSFHLSAIYSPIQGFISSFPNLNKHSLVWFTLMIHDSLITLVGSILVVFMYRLNLPKLPFNLVTMLLMQLPLTILMYRTNVVPLTFTTAYDSATSIATLVSCTSVVVVFGVFIAYNRLIKNDSIIVN